MLEILKEYWFFILWLLGITAAVTKTQNDVSDLKKDKPVTDAHCKERQAGCGRSNDLQFADGLKQFERLEKLIEKVEDNQQENHKSVMQAIMELKK